MNLIDENEEKEQEANKKKIFKIIIIAISVLVVIAVILLIYSTVKKNNTLEFNVDGNSKNITSGLFYMQDSKNIYVDENNQMYISVKKMASVLGVEYFNDEYKNKGEDTTKCYIKTSNEYTSYISNSNKIYKAIILDEQQETGAAETNKKNQEVKKVTEYEYFEVESAVKYINGEIYASQEAIELGFNIQISYNQSKKDINVLTLDGLEQVANKRFQNKSVTPVIGDDCSYQNKKLLKFGLVLIKNAENCYGITNYYNYSDGNYIVSCKYSNIRFCESTGNLIVTTLADGKQGILKLDLNTLDNAKTIIEPNYQLIRRMDEDIEIYLIKVNGKYGIIELEGETISTLLRPEYQQIGIDTVYENMENEYVINNKYIPIEIDNKWGIITVDGELLISPQFAGIGCNLGQTGSGDGVIVLPELVNGIDGIVFLTDQENKLYGIVNVRDCSKIGIDASEIYSVYENNERKYYMKISYDSNNTMRINIYEQFGKKVKEADKIDEEKLNNTVNAQSNNTADSTSTTNQVNNESNNNSVTNQVSNTSNANTNTQTNNAGNNSTSNQVSNSVSSNTSVQGSNTVQVNANTVSTNNTTN